MHPKLSIYLSSSLNPYHNLALEHALLMQVHKGELWLYLWRNERTVVVGRNQNIYAEVNLDALREIDGYPTRRLSGGGAVYHDVGNLNFTFLAQNECFNICRQSDVVLNAIRSLGFNAEKSGRNDLTIDGRKFSGQSFYQARERRFHNGTVLIATDRKVMQRVLTPSSAKFVGKGVQSVRSRTVNLSELASDITWENVQQALIRSFEEEYGGGATILPKIDTHQLQEDIFANHDFIYNKVADFTKTRELRTAEGTCTLHLDVQHGIIRHIQIFTDALNPDIVLILHERFDRYINRPLIDFDRDYA